MKIISKIETANWSYKCHCYRCSTDLEADSNDLFKKEETKHSSDPRDYGDTYSYKADVYYVTCPVCNNNLNVDDGKIPYVLKQKVKSK